ncbi:hypothetical protein TorRG33x02_128830 [Trema orientale]|uniref:Uncharacterized protein n=1 Tax=Trema orientale TaxID=63057 RepID=A0A2P5F0L2_TREOI|nr:hypothetical protein TorRG33x02_128830 [Trema orientale]
MMFLVANSGSISPASDITCEEAIAKMSSCLPFSEGSALTRQHRDFSAVRLAMKCFTRPTPPPYAETFVSVSKLLL